MGAFERICECSECDRLEHLYEQFVARIFALLDTRFNDPGAKIRELCRLQDMRDHAIRSFYEHKKSHRTVANT